MNLRIVLSIFTIAGILVLAGAGTYAAFSSQATNAGNTFGAGTLTLAINTLPGDTSTPVFTIPSAAPGQSFAENIVLSNTGSIDASTVNMTTINASGSSELASHLTLQLFHDVDEDSVFDVGETSFGSSALNDPVWDNLVLSGVTLPAGDTVHLGAILTFDSEAGNSVQGHSVTFSIGFQANQ